ncbi:hypothetical protein A2U01_0080988, partial [Trifolium medium]|nr:hypothetical protein [Trifolium medium]
ARPYAPVGRSGLFPPLVTGEFGSLREGGLSLE